jgi:isoleucyl-tRNA synthetase
MYINVNNESLLVYEGFKSMHICPRCETTLSNFEVGLEYKDVADISVTAKFELIDQPGTFILAWTTTPWTLPGNVALAINEKIKYVKVESGEEKFILAENKVTDIFEGKEYKILEELELKDLLNKSYRPLFDYYSKDKSLENRDNGWKIYSADFVMAEEGTGVVHMAPAFGNEDYQLSLEKKFPFINHVKMSGEFKDEVTDFAGMKVKQKDDYSSTDIEILKNLAHRNLLFEKKKINHSYPHCWRCKTPLISYATSSWFIKVTKLKNKLIEENKKITWTPNFVGEKRFGNWLENATDWAISRNRYWGAPIPVWRSDDGSEIEVIGSLDDLLNKIPQKNSLNLHKL